MKSNDIQRSVRAQKIDRAVGDAPVIGRLSRIPGTGLPKGIRKKRRRGESRRGSRQRAQKKWVIWMWSSVFVLMALGVLGTTVVLWIRSTKQSSVDEESGPSATYPVEKRSASRFESPSEEVALEHVKQALLVRDPAVVSKYFRLGTTEPDVAVAFLQNIAKTDGPVTGYTWLSSMYRNGLLIDGVLVLKGNREYSPSSRLALLTPDETGQWQIDYDAFARTCKPAWQGDFDQKFPGGLIRVFVTKDSYYNSLFANESQWSCYRLFSPDWKESLMGYCRTNTPELAAMLRIIDNARASGGTPGAVRMVLEIERVEGAEARQFRIARVLAEDWVQSATPFDEQFK